jgi:alkylation response protein AidB-like acyl-CoA dehydrogenase
MARYENSTDLMRAVEEILPTIRDEAAASEAAGRMTETALAALFSRRLFRLFIPRTLDGEEIDLSTALRVFESISAADGAAGWTVMIGAGAGLFAGFLESAAARDIFLDEQAVIAGSGAPTGIARKVRGGYRVSGRWAYASGAHHATWFTANCVVDDGTAAARSDAPSIRSVAVPAVDVRIHETWSVSGMRGTGSDDIEITDAFVPFSHTFSVIDDSPKVPGPLYRLPFYSFAELTFASVSLGIARHALGDFADMAKEKRPMGAEQVLARDPDVQARSARAEAAVSAARSFVFDVAGAAWEAVVRQDEISGIEQARIRLAAVDAVQRCAQAVDLLYERAGMTPLFYGSTLGRAWRDIHAVTQNMLVSADRYADTGRTLLDSD